MYIYSPFPGKIGNVDLRRKKKNICVCIQSGFVSKRDGDRHETGKDGSSVYPQHFTYEEFKVRQAENIKNRDRETEEQTG